VRTTVLLAEAQSNVDNTKWLASAPTSARGILNIGGTGGLTRTQRVKTATTAVTVLADIYTFYRFVASGSASEPQIFCQGRNGPLLRKQV
jgi:hypothetical protein